MRRRRRRRASGEGDNDNNSQCNCILSAKNQLFTDRTSGAELLLFYYSIIVYACGFVCLFLSFLFFKNKIGKISIIICRFCSLQLCICVCVYVEKKNIYILFIRIYLMSSLCHFMRYIIIVSRQKKKGKQDRKEN